MTADQEKTKDRAWEPSGGLDVKGPQRTVMNPAGRQKKTRQRRAGNAVNEQR
jgi:hypothetical protein